MIKLWIARLKRIRITTRGFTGHSFRQAIAQDAHNMGLSDADIQLEKGMDGPKAHVSQSMNCAPAHGIPS